MTTSIHPKLEAKVWADALDLKHDKPEHVFRMVDLYLAAKPTKEAIERFIKNN